MNENLRVLVDLRTVMQKNRIAFGLRIDAIKREADNADDRVLQNFGQWHERFLELEKHADGQIRDMAQDYPIVQQMVEVKGISFILAAKAVSLIDISRAPTISALWRYAGYGLNRNGERDKPTKGEKLKYNNRLKSTIYNISSSFLKANSPYREIYDIAKEKYELEKTDWTKLHRHLASMRKMSKMFLSHLWLRWRQIEGFPISEPYIMADLKHSRLRIPEEFGWPAIALKNPKL